MEQKGEVNLVFWRAHELEGEPLSQSTNDWMHYIFPIAAIDKADAGRGEEQILTKGRLSPEGISVDESEGLWWGNWLNFRQKLPEHLVPLHKRRTEIQPE